MLFYFPLTLFGFGPNFSAQVEHLRLLKINPRKLLLSLGLVQRTWICHDFIKISVYIEGGNIMRSLWIIIWFQYVAQRLREINIIHLYFRSLTPDWYTSSIDLLAQSHPFLFKTFWPIIYDVCHFPSTIHVFSHFWIAVFLILDQSTFWDVKTVWSLQTSILFKHRTLL